MPFIKMQDCNHIDPSGVYLSHRFGIMLNAKVVRSAFMHHDVKIHKDVHVLALPSIVIHVIILLPLQILLHCNP